MGQIRTKDIKDIAFELVEKYPEKFTDDFVHNKKMIKELNLFTSKKYINRVAGYVTRVMVRKRF